MQRQHPQHFFGSHDPANLGPAITQMRGLDDSTLVAFVDGELDYKTACKVSTAISIDPDSQEKIRRLRRSAILVRAAFSEG